MNVLNNCLAVVLVLSAGTATAQEKETDYREKFVFGLRVGANYANVYDTEGEDFDADARFGLAAGAYVSIPVGKYLGIHPEVLISQKGFRATGRLENDTYELNRLTTWLDIPLLVEVKPSEFLSLVAGPQFSYLLHQRDAFGNGTNSIAQEQAFDNDNIRKNTFGVVGGLDLNIRHFVMGARAGCDLFRNNGDGSSDTPRYKNVWFQGTLGIRF